MILYSAENMSLGHPSLAECNRDTIQKLPIWS